MWTGDAPFDHYNEADSILNDLINAPPIKLNFMNLDKEVHRSPI